MNPHRSKWSHRPNAEYFSLDEDCAFVLKRERGGGRLRRERESERAEVRSLCLSLVKPTDRLSPLSQAPSHSVFLSLCMYVFEVYPFVLGDCARLVLTIECSGVEGDLKVLKA